MSTQIYPNPPVIDGFYTEDKITKGYRSISAWKTEKIFVGGVWCVKITEGSDGNDQFLGKIYRIVRFEFSGGKIVFDPNRCLG